MPHKFDKLGRLRMRRITGETCYATDRKLVAKWFFEDGDDRAMLAKFFEITEDDVDACIRKALKPVMERESEDEA